MRNFLGTEFCHDELNISDRFSDHAQAWSRLAPGRLERIDCGPGGRLCWLLYAWLATELGDNRRHVRFLVHA